MIDPEIRDLKVEWVKLPGAMPGMRHLHIATTHGDNSVREFWLTEKQGQAVGQFACAEREAKLIADTRLEEAEAIWDQWAAKGVEQVTFTQWLSMRLAAHRAALQEGKDV